MNIAVPIQPGKGIVTEASRPAWRRIGSNATRSAKDLYQVRPKEIWKFFKQQKASFWLLCLYMFWEYVRFQDIYPSLSNLGLPFWTLILCAVVFLFEGNHFRAWTLADTLLVAFSLIILASSVTAYEPAVSFGYLSLFFSWVLVYFLITSIVNTEGRFLVFMLLYVLYCVKMTQHGIRSWAGSGFGFITMGVGCAPSWFQNSGECGIQMAMLFPVSLFFALALRTYWSKIKFWGFMAVLPFGSVVMMVASSSRGALLGLAGVVLWMVVKSRHRMKGLGIAAALALVVVTILPDEQKARFQEMGEDGTSISRTTYWTHGLEIMDRYPVLGIGYSNWLPYYRAHYNPAGELSHNIFIEAGSELGYTGLLAFVALIIGTFVLNHQTRRSARVIPEPGGRFFFFMAHGFDGAVIGYIISGFFVTVLYYPFFWINLSMTTALFCVTAAKASEAKRLAGASAPHRGRTRASVPPHGRGGHAS